MNIKEKPPVGKNKRPKIKRNSFRNLNKSQNILKQFETFKEFSISSLEWLANTVNLPYSETTLILRVANKILNIFESRGKTEVIRYTKDLRLKFTKTVLKTCPVEFNFKSQSKSFPKYWKAVLSQLESGKNTNFIRCLFSTLYLTRSIRLDGEISFESITKESTHSVVAHCQDSDIKSFLQDIGINPVHFGRVPKALSFKEFHMTSKSGPNGHALWTSYKDLSALTPEQRDAISVVAGGKLSDLMNKFANLYERIPTFFDERTTRKGLPQSRRISKIVDKEGKIREVAIGDYYSQAALLPLHNYLYRILSNINQDCTSDQTKLFYNLECSIKNSYHSVDLKAFTDRFPIEINKRILEVWFGTQYADA